MEETIGYEALLSTEEWDSLDLAESDGLPEGGGSPNHRVSVTIAEDGYELACYACPFVDHVSDVTEADNIKRFHEDFVSDALDLGEWKEELQKPHEVTVGRDFVKTSAAYVAVCLTCGPIGAADDEALASVLARLHENFVAKLADRWRPRR